MYSCTGDTFGLESKAMLGIQAVQIFGTNAITPSIKQIVSYVPFYIDKAVADGQAMGVPLTLQNFSDGLMEGKHKEPKVGNKLFSGGKNGPIGTVEYQRQVSRTK